MMFKTNINQSILLLLALTFLPVAIFAQEDTPELMNGNFLTTVNFNYTGAERDLSNFEFERSFRRLNSSIQLTYLVTGNLGLGLELGSSNLVQTFDDSRDWFKGKDEFQRRISEYKYGIYPSYFFSLSSHVENYFPYIETGLFQIRSRWQEDGNGNKTVNNTGYRLGAGLLIQVGEKVFLNTKLIRDSFKADYELARQVGNTIEYESETKWPSTTSLYFGITIKF